MNLRPSPHAHALVHVHVLVLVLALVLGCLGCASRIAGSSDVELSYAVDPIPGGARLEGDLRGLVLQRFSAAQIGADVAVDDGDKAVRVVVDESLAPLADELLTWTGTVLVVDPDPRYVPETRTDATLTLTTRTERLPDGATERFWEGDRDAIMRAVETWPTDRDHRLVAEPIWGTATADGPPRYRTRAVMTVPVGELGDGVMVGRGADGTLRLRAQPGTLAADVIHDAKERPRPPLLVRGRTSLGVFTLADADAIVVSFGPPPRSYARAQDERRLLVSPRLPPLRRTGAVGLPPNRELWTACWVVPIALSIAWLVFVRRFDRAHPEPMWLVLVTFFAGAVATAPAALAEALLARATPWLDPRVVTLGGQLHALPLAAAVFTVVVGLVEESAKLLGASYAVRRPEFDEPVDGIVYGIVSSLGFAAAENVHYFAMSRLAAPTVIARCFMSIPAHMFFGAIWGYALGARLVDKKVSVWRALLVAAAMHGLFDALLATDGAGGLAVVLNVALASVFVALVRRALRHGVVDAEAAAVPAEGRLLFRVGRPALFFVSSAALHVLAFGIFVLGAYFQISRRSPTPLFVVGSSAMVLGLAFAAWGVTTTLPLDVAIDDYGVTLGGAARPWRKIRRYERDGDVVLLHCDPGPMRLGPALPATLDAIAAALDDHVGPRRADTLESVT